MAKAILFGEHAVVHGVPALAVPLPARRLRVDVEPDPSIAAIVVTVDGEGGEPASARETPEAREKDLEIARQMVRRALAAAPAARVSGLLTGARVRISSTVPMGSGLGSSAALAVALVRALHGPGLPPAEVSRLALDLERIAHGTPSGVDPAVIAYERPIAFRKDEPPEPLTLGAPLHLAVGILPREGTTASLVAGVRRLSETQPERFRGMIDAVRAAATMGRTYVERGNLGMVGVAMSANHGALRALGVSTPRLDEACEAACRAGALGAKLSGAGGGGALLALLRPDVDPSAVMQALRDSGAGIVFETIVEGGDARVEENYATETRPSTPRLRRSAQDDRT